MATAAEQFARVEYTTGPDSLHTKKPRVLYLIDEISGLNGGGTERQVLQLIRLAKRLGYEPYLAALRGTEWLTEEHAGCPVYSAGVESLFRSTGWRALWRLVRWMRRENIVMVQTFFVECNILGPWLARLAGVPAVISSRRNLERWWPRSAWRYPLMRGIQRCTNILTDRFVANSEGVVDTLLAGQYAPRHKIRVAYNGIDRNRFLGLAQQRREIRARLGLADDEILVGNVSCTRRPKGIPQFVRAARIVLEAEPTWRFLVVGDGEQYAEVESMVRMYGLEGRVLLVGAQTDVLPYLAAMDIGVLSSLAEGFSNSLLEYMASGLPAVATDVGGNREALGDTGILVPPDDPAALAEAILRLRSLSLRSELGAAAQRRVELFSVERAEERMKQIYGELLSSKGILQKKN